MCSDREETSSERQHARLSPARARGDTVRAATTTRPFHRRRRGKHPRTVRTHEERGVGEALQTGAKRSNKHVKNKKKYMRLRVSIPTPQTEECIKKSILESVAAFDFRH